MISAQGENSDDDELFADPLIPFRTKTSNYLTHHTQKLKHARNERRTTILKRILFTKSTKNSKKWYFYSSFCVTEKKNTL